MPSYISHGWKVKKPFCELLPDVDSQGEMIVTFLAWQEQGNILVKYNLII